MSECTCPTEPRYADIRTGHLKNCPKGQELLAKTGEHMRKLTDKEWESVKAGLDSIVDNEHQARMDMQMGDLTVLVYKVVSIIRIDIKASK